MSDIELHVHSFGAIVQVEKVPTELTRGAHEQLKHW